MSSHDAAPPVLRLSQAARQLARSTRELAGLVHEHSIRYVMVDGIAHIPTDAVDEFLADRLAER